MTPLVPYQFKHFVSHNNSKTFFLSKMALKNMSSLQKHICQIPFSSSFSQFQKSSSFKLSKTPFIANKIQLHHTSNTPTSCRFSIPKQASRLLTNALGWNLDTMRSNHHSAEDHYQRPSEVQELYLYEFNELDRGSPVYLRLSYKSVNSIGDIVTFTNKIYTGDLKKCLGTTAGSLLVMNPPGKTTKGDTYESTISFYFGDYGHISCQGPYKSNEDTWMAVNGGTGIFNGVYGQVKCHNLMYPLKLHYKFQLQGITQLPEELTRTPVEPRPDLQPAPEAKLAEAALVN